MPIAGELESGRWPLVAIVASLAAHAAAVAALHTVPRAAPLSRRPAEVSFEIEMPKLPPPVAEQQPERPPAPEPPHEPSLARTEKQRLAPETSAPARDDEAREPPAPVDLTGVTLVNDSEGGWASAVGNGSGDGSALRYRPPVARWARGSAANARSAKSTPNQDLIVAAADLSKRPEPPPLGPLLLRNYPAEARRRGLGGVARVRLRIDRDGIATNCSVLSASDAAFGEACRRTVQDSRWSPPLDADGRAVVTYVQYTCRFEVEQ